MKVIVGLGNPGREYAGTRHNVGWWFVDHLADVWRFERWKKDGLAQVASGLVHGAHVRLIKPQTFMNLSGEALRPYLRRPFWSASTDLLVAVDEVQLPIGRYRFRAKGSPGGHNGMKSVEAHVHTQEYARLRIGVGQLDDAYRKDIPLYEYVLGEFSKAEASYMRAILSGLAPAVELWIKEGILPVMNQYPGKPSSDDSEPKIGDE